MPPANVWFWLVGVLARVAAGIPREKACQIFCLIFCASRFLCCLVCFSRTLLCPLALPEAYTVLRVIPDKHKNCQES